jgi:hypothetical protein
MSLPDFKKMAEDLTREPEPETDPDSKDYSTDQIKKDFYWRGSVNGKPTLLLPNASITYLETIEHCREKLIGIGKLFNRSGDIVEMVDSKQGKQLNVVSSELFRIELDRHFSLGMLGTKNGTLYSTSARCSHDQASVLMAGMLEHLPSIQGIVESPVFAEDEDGNLAVLNRGYHPQRGGFLVTSKRDIRTDIPLDEATETILDLTRDFSFVTESDRSRFIAAIIAPALRMGGLLATEFPLALTEADQSQSGKSYGMKLIFKIYGANPHPINLNEEKGVGSVEEKLSEGMLLGKTFICLENIRGGNFKCQLLDSAIKGIEVVSVRVAYSKGKTVSTDHIIWVGTSNGVQTNRDLANRFILTRIRKQPESYVFKEYPEGDLLDHVTEQRDYILSCVYSIVREWHDRGKPRTRDTRHDLREYCQTMDWIIQEVFKLLPLLEGHQQEQDRLCSPGFSFLRDVSITVQQIDMIDQELTATDIANVCVVGGISIPGCSDKVPEEGVPKIIGGLLKPLFRASQNIEVEGFKVARTEKRIYNEKRQENISQPVYQFHRNGIGQASLI